MAAGIAGLRDVLTAAESLRINTAGDQLRERLNELMRARDIAGTVTGYGSMMMVQLAPGSFVRAADTARVPNEIRALCQLEMIAQGIYVSRRNMFNLSLPMGPAEFDRIAAAFDAFLEEHALLLQHSAASTAGP
jgi:glutamate-1-semialdehyde aminotransferase